jgi:hypothetical protein
MFDAWARRDRVAALDRVLAALHTQRRDAQQALDDAEAETVRLLVELRYISDTFDRLLAERAALLPRPREGV